MTTTLTREALIAFVDAYDAERIASHTDGAEESTGLADLSTIADAGTPANAAFAKSLGGDYICALDDGSIAAWGGDTVLAPGLIGRDLVFISPAEQIA